MQKIIILFLFILLSISAFSKAVWFQTTAFNFKLTNHEWTGWQASDLTVAWEIDDSRLTIFSSDKQIIDYEPLVIKDYGQYLYCKSFATDTKHVLITFEIFIYTDGDVFIKITYADAQYKYKVKEMSPQP